MIRFAHSFRKKVVFFLQFFEIELYMSVFENCSFVLISKRSFEALWRKIWKKHAPNIKGETEFTYFLKSVKKIISILIEFQSTWNFLINFIHFIAAVFIDVFWLQLLQNYCIFAKYLQTNEKSQILNKICRY